MPAQIQIRQDSYRIQGGSLCLYIEDIVYTWPWHGSLENVLNILKTDLRFEELMPTGLPTQEKLAQIEALTYFIQHNIPASV